MKNRTKMGLSVSGVVAIVFAIAALAGSFKKEYVPEVHFEAGKVYNMAIDSVEGDIYFNHFELAEFPDTTFTFPGQEQYYVSEADFSVPAGFSKTFDDIPDIYMKIGGSISAHYPEGYVSIALINDGEKSYVKILRDKSNPQDVSPDFSIDSTGVAWIHPKNRANFTLQLDLQDYLVSDIGDIYFRLKY